MTEIIYLDDNWSGRNITRRNIDHVLRSTISEWEEMPERQDGNTRVMYVGLDESGRLLEVGVEYLDDDIEKVFHADNATPQYKDLFERARR